MVLQTAVFVIYKTCVSRETYAQGLIPYKLAENNNQ